MGSGGRLLQPGSQQTLHPALIASEGTNSPARAMIKVKESKKDVRWDLEEKGTRGGRRVIWAHF